MPIVAQVAGAAAGAIPEIYRLYQGSKQQKEAKELQKRLRRPSYSTPEAIQEATNRARLAASDTTLPGQGRMEQNIQGTSANALAASKELGNRDVAGIYAGQKNAMRNLGLDAANAYQGKQAALSGALGTAGQYQEKEWDYNKRSPYEEGAAKAAALQEAGNQNVMGAISNLGGVAGGAIGAAGGGAGGFFGSGKKSTGLATPNTVQPPQGSIHTLSKTLGGGSVTGTPGNFISPPGNIPNTMEIETIARTKGLSASDIAQLKTMNQADAWAYLQSL